MEQIIDYHRERKEVPTLLLHCCCAPCSSAVLERLANDFKITLFYYNPNITNEQEYQKRLQELKRFVLEYPLKYPCSIIEGKYDPLIFLNSVSGMEKEKEGGKRCYVCYQMRLEQTAKVAKEQHFDYFTTTLSISPYKNATWLNEIGASLAKQYQVDYLYADFKKKDGYKRSILLSSEYHLYRQDYCGCTFSMIDRH